MTGKAGCGHVINDGGPCTLDDNMVPFDEVVMVSVGRSCLVSPLYKRRPNMFIIRFTMNSKDTPKDRYKINKLKQIAVAFTRRFTTI